MQELFDTTGAVHAAGVLDPDGAVVLAREDVGRHNAVDKVVGRLVLDRQVPATGRAVVVSGRASFELVHKAWAAGFRALVAVSAPTALAVATAERAGCSWLVSRATARSRSMSMRDSMPAVSLLGVPYDAHSSFLRGPAGAPAAVRAALDGGSANWCTERGSISIRRRVPPGGTSAISISPRRSSRPWPSSGGGRRCDRRRWSVGLDRRRSSRHLAARPGDDR